MSRTPSSKRAEIPRQVTHTGTFKKSWERYKRAGRRDMNAVADVMALLFLRKPIPAEYEDHELEGGEWDKARELHVGGDFLLVYKINDRGDLVTFIDIGSHSELFG